MEQTIHHQVRTNKCGKVTGWIFLGILAAAAFTIALGYIIMLLWNWLMPDLFGLTTISYWQAVGVFILAKLLFGAFGHHKYSARNDKFHDRYKRKLSKENISKWKHYDSFWKEKGEKAFNDYIVQKENENSTEHK